MAIIALILVAIVVLGVIFRLGMPLFIAVANWIDPPTRQGRN